MMNVNHKKRMVYNQGIMYTCRQFINFRGCSEKVIGYCILVELIAVAYNYRRNSIFSCFQTILLFTSNSSIQTLAHPSVGIRRSPLGETETDPTFGPSGRQLYKSILHISLQFPYNNTKKITKQIVSCNWFVISP